MRVSIDQERCTGDALCADVCPELFFTYDDGHTYRCYVRPAGESGRGDDGAPALRTALGAACVPRSLEDAALEAAEHCPGECIVVDDR
jgi:ferredoxin